MIVLLKDIESRVDRLINAKFGITINKIVDRITVNTIVSITLRIVHSIEGTEVRCRITTTAVITMATVVIVDIIKNNSKIVSD